MESSSSSSPNVWNVLKGNTVGGLLLSSFSVPTDVVRNYWYFNPELKDRRNRISTLDVARHIYGTRGARCFFTGFHLTVFNVVAGQTIFLISYDTLKWEMSAPMASILSRMATLLSMQPLESLRTFRQANLSHNTKTFFADVKGFAAFRTCYKGLVPTIIRDVPFSALHWPLNDLIYRLILGFRQKTDDNITRYEKLSLSFVTGAMSSTIATIISQPFDIVKTNIQATTDRTVKMTVRSELSRFFGQYGMRGFLIGLTPRLMKVVPGCAIISGCYRYFN